MEKEYVGRASKTDFKSVRRPPIDKDFSFHFANRLSKALITGVQFAILFILAPTNKPRYLKGVTLFLQFRPFAASETMSSSTFIPQITDLEKLIFRPDMMLKFQSSFLMKLKLVSLHSPQELHHPHKECEILTNRGLELKSRCIIVLHISCLSCNLKPPYR